MTVQIERNDYQGKRGPASSYSVLVLQPVPLTPAWVRVASGIPYRRQAVALARTLASR